MAHKISLKNISRFTQGKLVSAFLIAGIALISSWIISRALFSDIEESVSELSQPNENLLIVNRLIEKVSKLDQLQRIQVIKNPLQAKSFLGETKNIYLMLDTLSIIYATNEIIGPQVDSMKQILSKRDRVYVDYVSLRLMQQNNPELSNQLKNISGLIRQNAGTADTAVITTRNKITTHAAPKKQEQESFWKRLFGKKKKQEEQRLISEELNVKVDSVSVARKNQIALELDAALHSVKESQTTRNNNMLLQELELLSSGNSLINELWSLLHKVQDDEIAKMRSNSTTAIEYYNSGINRVGILLMLVFLVIAALVFAVLNDLTKSNEYRKQLLLAKDEAEQASIMKQRFLSNMSHEIRTPLQSIIGFSEQANMSEKPDKEMLHTIHNSARHLLHIVNEILDYSRITSGKFVLENKVFNLYNLVEEVAQIIKPQVDVKGLSFTLLNKADPGKNYRGDGFRLKQILFNLLGNAVKFTSTGGIVLSISESRDDHFTIKVTDTGTGISDENLHKIFSEFEQSDESIGRKFGGSGLGLSISKTLLEAMGGLIEVESEEGIGTTFIIKLPLSETSDKVKTNNSYQITSYQNIQTVVVDDDPFILSLCDTILTKHKIKHICFRTAEDLLKVQWNNQTKLVFTDIRLPGKSGIELIDELKKKNISARFIALTAQVLPEEKEHLLNKGFDKILSKPFLENELMAFYENAQSTVITSSLNLSLLKRMTMNDDALLRKHIAAFILNTNEDLLQLAKNIEETNQSNAYEIIHKLVGRTGQAGATDIMKKLRHLELTLQKPNGLETSEILLNEVIRDLKLLVNEMENYNM